MDTQKDTITLTGPQKTASGPAHPRPNPGGGMSPADYQRIVVEWNDTHTAYPVDVCLHELIEAQVERTPDTVAVAFEGSELTYRELNGRANKLAEALRGFGVGPDVPVAVCIERSLEMVVGLVGILKAGGAYMPVDPHYPQDRVAFMLGHAKTPVVLTQSHLAAKLPEYSGQVICLDHFHGASAQNRASGVKPGNLAYVIYTSGSTGAPKGVMSIHLGICNRLFWMQEEYGLTADDRVLQKTPFTFDVSVWEFFWPLMTGARLVVAKPGGHMDSAYLIRTIRDQRITTLHFVPSMLGVFLMDRDAGKCDSIKRVICSGEALSMETQRRFFEVFPNVELHNLYGPTEASVDVTYWKCDPASRELTVPIGRPVANTQMYILDEAMQPVDAGVPGELHIGGVQLARGYVGRPDLTAEKFVPDPFSNEPGARLYKTGDLARFRDDAVIIYLGRIDHQVKIRGFRIELEEIESVLAHYPGVEQCSVIAREDQPGDKRLVAYVVSGGAIKGEALSLFLKDKLPEYMVPSAFVFIDALPLNANGKLDRKALPAPVRAHSAGPKEFDAPRNEMEKTIAGVWESVLRVEHIGIRDNFFDAGGNSLKLIEAHMRLREDLKTDIAITTLFEHPTIAALADFLGRKDDSNSAAQDRARKQREAMARRKEVRKAS